MVSQDVGKDTRESLYLVIVHIKIVGGREDGYEGGEASGLTLPCLLYTSPSPRDKRQSRMPSSA